MHNFAKYGVRALYYIGTYVFSPKDNIILFESSNGRNYTGNPRFIYEELLRQGLDKEYECVWVFMNPQEQTVPGNPKKVKKRGEKKAPPHPKDLSRFFSNSFDHGGTRWGRECKL